jgi:hypothetical protein
VKVIALGASVNFPDLIGQIPLRVAVLKGDSICTDYLIFCGSYVNIADRDGKSIPFL